MPGIVSPRLPSSVDARAPRVEVRSVRSPFDPVRPAGPAPAPSPDRADFEAHPEPDARRNDKTIPPLSLARLANRLAILVAAATISGTNPTAVPIPPPATYQGPVPTVQYVPQSGPSMLYNNNPEQLTTAELADTRFGAHTIYRERLSPGPHRNFFEHLNFTGRTIGYGVRIYNPGPGPIEVEVKGSGFEPSIRGGEPFRQMLGRPYPGTVHHVPAGRSVYLLRQDAAVRPAAFFSGAVDFDVRGGEALLDNLAYADIHDVGGSLSYVGYVQRTQLGGVSEARMYKGFNPTAAVVATGVDFSVDDGTGNGTLPVQHQTYDLDQGTYRAAELSREGWFTHIGPKYQPKAVTSDMIGFDTPGWGRIDPLRPSDGKGLHPNVGNWGVLYTVEGTVTNSGTRPRDVVIGLRANPRHSAFLAFDDGGSWASKRLEPGDVFPYHRFTVAPGQSRSYRASMVLGGPSGGNLQQYVALEETPAARTARP